jgi:lipopolysaccharide assembly outer membrane protein LptD (OstA)
MRSSVPFKMKPALLLVLPYLLALVFAGESLHADAYLTEDRVYYGADTYTVDYDEKVVNAVGRAFFRKEKRRVDADRIVIHYAPNRKIAYFYGNVILTDERNRSRITGRYAEAKFREDFYFIEGETSYRDDKRSITSRRIETKEGEGYRFIDNVRFNDGTYEITASALNVTDDIAVFEKGTHAVHLKSHDSIDCDKISYMLESEDVTFTGEALYIEREGSEEENTLVIRSDVIRYFNEGDLFVLVGDVLVMNGLYTLRSSVVRYHRSKRLVEASGDIVVWDGKKYVYCNNLEYDVSTDRVLFLTDVRGVFRSAPDTSGKKGNS